MHARSMHSALSHKKVPDWFIRDEPFGTFSIIRNDSEQLPDPYDYSSPCLREMMYRLLTSLVGSFTYSLFMYRFNRFPCLLNTVK